MARPSFKPTEAQRKQVESMAGFGVPLNGIALTLDISKPTLIKHFRRELDVGHVKANTAVAQSLYRKATGDGAQSVAAAIFWAKTRMGWKDTTVLEHTGGVAVADVAIRTDDPVEAARMYQALMASPPVRA